jgi:hypothetical protein
LLVWHGQNKPAGFRRWTRLFGMARLVECPLCGCEYPPEATRWMCPECKFKDTCCDGEPRVKKMRDNIEQDY